MIGKTEEWVTVIEAARMTGKAPRQIRSMINKKRLESTKHSGRLYVSRKDLVSKYLPTSCVERASSDQGHSGFFEVDMGQILQAGPCSGDKPDETPGAVAGLRVHLTRGDGSHLEMTVSETDGRTAEGLIRVFLGG